MAESKEKKIVLALFEFEVDGEQKEIEKCIESQIITDQNVYWQNMDSTAQMTSIKLVYDAPEEIAKAIEEEKL